MSLRRTPLHECHVRLGARLVEFAGHEMPVQYEGVVPEHRAVRTSAGLFDVSHMGELTVEGPGALDLLQRLTPNDVARLRPGRAHYSSFLTDAGTFVDDLLVYRRAEDRFLVVVNASNRDEDHRWVLDGRDEFASDLAGEVEIEDHSDRIALLALQGPRALEVIDALHDPAAGGAAPSALRYYAFQEGGSLAGQPVILLSRTGYTGEDGVEVYLDRAHAAAAWEALVAHEAVTPAGLGARDTLRLEAGMCLYGHEIDAETTPLEAGLAWTVKLDKGAFRGRDVLARQAAEGTVKRLVGLEVVGRGIARQGHAVLDGDEPVGVVTSGTHSPTLERAVAMAHVHSRCAETGTELNADVRGRRVPVRVVDLPFYSRPGSGS